MEVVELVPCARNKWGNWWEFWFYVSEGTVEDHPGLLVAVMCSHYYVAYCNTLNLGGIKFLCSYSQIQVLLPFSHPSSFFSFLFL
jgi:hypothetical protein